jgi:hypothetical protein
LNKSKSSFSPSNTATAGPAQGWFLFHLATWKTILSELMSGSYGVKEITMSGNLF